MAYHKLEEPSSIGGVWDFCHAELHGAKEGVVCVCADAIGITILPLPIPGT